MATADLERYTSELTEHAKLVLLTLEGDYCAMNEHHLMPQSPPTEAQWAKGLTSMRQVMLRATDARIVLGGRTEGYKGVMPGVAEEALLSLQARQPLFLIGGYGGCARDIAEVLGLILPSATSRPRWKELDAFDTFKGVDLRNGLTPEENATLARTPHIDEAIALILRGLFRLEQEGWFARTGS